MNGPQGRLLTSHKSVSRFSSEIEMSHTDTLPCPTLTLRIRREWETRALWTRAEDYPHKSKMPGKFSQLFFFF